MTSVGGEGSPLAPPRRRGAPKSGVLAPDFDRDSGARDVATAVDLGTTDAVPAPESDLTARGDTVGVRERVAIGGASGAGVACDER